MGDIERSARAVAGDMPRETFEKAVEAAAKAVCAHRSYRMIAAEVLASVNHAGAVSSALGAMEADAQRRLAAGDAPMVAAADLDALARVRRLHGGQ
jgi:hypothetical protein